MVGGAGFLGSWIANAFNEQDWDVLVVDDLSTGRRSNLRDGVDFAEVDVRNASAIDKTIQYFEPGIVYHLAANAREGASFFQPISVVTRNTQGYINVLTSSINHWVKRIVLFSSIAVYGHNSPPFQEKDPLNPADIYGLQKANMEEMTKMLSGSHGIEYIIFRPHNCFGENQAINDKHRNVIGIWMNQIMRGEPLTVYGNGTQSRAFSYIHETLPAYLAALSIEPNQTFNIGSDKNYQIIDVLQMVTNAMGVSSDYPIRSLQDRHQEVKHAYSDHSKMLDVFNITGGDDIRPGIKAMAKWARGVGPQEWQQGDELEIPNDLTPVNWKEK